MAGLLRLGGGSVGEISALHFIKRSEDTNGGDDVKQTDDAEDYCKNRHFGLNDLQGDWRELGALSYGSDDETERAEDVGGNAELSKPHVDGNRGLVGCLVPKEDEQDTRRHGEWHVSVVHHTRDSNVRKAMNKDAVDGPSQESP